MKTKETELEYEQNPSKAKANNDKPIEQHR